MVMFLSHLLALGAMLLTAWSYARFSKNSERSGSAYSYTAESLGPKSGFFVGWCSLLDYLLLPLLMCYWLQFISPHSFRVCLIGLGAGIGGPCNLSQLFPYSVTCQPKPRVCVRTDHPYGHFCIFSHSWYWLDSRL